MKKRLLLILFSFYIFAVEFVSAQIPSYVPTNGLVGWWPFNGNANDESGNGNNGIANGTSLITDRFGNSDEAFAFNGTSNFLEIPFSQQLSVFSGNFSIMLWVKNELPINHAGAHILWRPAYASFVIGIGAGSNKIDFAQGGVLSFYATNSVFVNDWQQIVLTKNFNNISVYTNGYLDGVYLDNISFVDYGNLIFGKAPNSGGGFNGSYYFKGSLDDIAIYNRALSQQEITELYNACSSPITSEFSATSCEQYVLPWGDSVNASGDYSHTYSNPGSCDSIVTAHVTINHAVAGASENVSGTSSYALPWGTTAVQSGYYTHLYQNINGCDSLVTYYVVINKPSSADNKYVGVNVENPQRALHVKDVIRLDPRNAPPEDPTKGDMYFDGVTNKLRIYDGSVWRDAY
jgi:hypothetical protein